jgi:hypothetical protein
VCEGKMERNHTTDTTPCHVASIDPNTVHWKLLNGGKRGEEEREREDPPLFVKQTRHDVGESRRSHLPLLIQLVQVGSVREFLRPASHCSRRECKLRKFRDVRGCASKRHRKLDAARCHFFFAFNERAWWKEGCGGGSRRLAWWEWERASQLSTPQTHGSALTHTGEQQEAEGSRDGDQTRPGSERMGHAHAHAHAHTREEEEEEEEEEMHVHCEDVGGEPRQPDHQPLPHLEDLLEVA